MKKKECSWFLEPYAGTWLTWPAGQASVWSRSCHRFCYEGGPWRRSGLDLYKTLPLYPGEAFSDDVPPQVYKLDETELVILGLGALVTDTIQYQTETEEVDLFM